MIKSITKRGNIVLFGVCCLSVGHGVMASGKPSSYAMDRWAKEDGLSDVGVSVLGERQPTKPAAERRVPQRMAAAAEESPYDEYDGSASTIEYGQTQARLIDDPELMKHIRRGYLNITPQNYEELSQHAQGFVKKGLFNRFDGGIWIRAEETKDLDTEIVLLLSRTMHKVKKYRVSMDVSRSRESGVDLIAESLYGLNHLKEIDMSNCSLTDGNMREILDAISSPDVEVLNISNNRITQALLPSIRRKLERLVELITDFDTSGSVADIATRISDVKITDVQKSNRLGEAKVVASKEDVSLIQEREGLAAEKEALDKARREMEQQRLEIEEKRKAEEDRQKIQSERESLEKQRKEIEAERQALQRGLLSVVERPINGAIPALARGHEEVYRRFMNGRLVYKGPAGERSFLISDSVNSSLEGEFNLSGLTYTSGSTTYNIDTYLRIRLGYRKSVENETKVTVWLVPKFVVSGVESSFSTVEWTSDIGIFWTYGKDALSSLNYLTKMQFDEISSKNLYELGRGCGGFGGSGRVGLGSRAVRPAMRRTRAGHTAACFPLFLIKF